MVSRPALHKDGGRALDLLTITLKTDSENVRLPPRKMDLATLAEKICEVHGIHAGELRSGSRRGEISKKILHFAM
jgi:hypothetical protein